MEHATFIIVSYLGFTVFSNVISLTGLFCVEMSVLLGLRLREACKDLT